MGQVEMGVRRGQDLAFCAAAGTAQNLPDRDAQHSAVVSIVARQAPRHQRYLANTTSSESDIEARRCLDTLQETIQRVVDQNQALSRRLEQLDFYLGAEDTSVRFFDDDQSVIQAQGALSPNAQSGTPQLVLPKLEDPIPLEAAFNSAIAPGTSRSPWDRRACTRVPSPMTRTSRL